MTKYGVISGPYFTVFGLNTGKYGPDITPYLDTFHAVNDEGIAKTFNKYFCTIAKNLSLPENLSVKEPSVELFTDPVILALEKYEDHPSIVCQK